MRQGAHSFTSLYCRLEESWREKDKTHESTLQHFTESGSKDNTSCLTPSAFKEIGLGSLKIITGLLQRATSIAHIFLLNRKPCKVLNVWLNAQVKGAIVTFKLPCHPSDITETRPSEGSWHQGPPTGPVKKSKHLSKEEFNDISLSEVKTSLLTF